MKDLECTPFHVSQVFDDVDDQMWFHNTLLSNVIDKNAPRKQKSLTGNQLLYMNNQLRKAINVKSALWRKYTTVKSEANWQQYQKQRNLVNKLKRASLKNYLDERCNSGKKQEQAFLAGC